MTTTSGPRPVRAPRGSELTCRGWAQEAALRMLMNNLDPEVAEDPDHLVVYGGTGKAARSWEAFDAIVRELRALADDETLLVQSGKPVGVVRTHEWAPRVLIANSNLVGKWATWEVFRELEQAGLMMYGQMTAGSWIYIGTQGILQGTYETFAEAARQHFGGSLRGTVTLTAGLGGMGGAQPLAVTMNEGVCLAIEVDEARARRRVEIGYVDRLTHDPVEALRWARAAAADGEAVSIALVGNAAEIEPAWAAAGERFDIVTDQTSAHDALGGYVPAEIGLADALTLRASQPDEYQRRSRAAMAAHVRAMLAFQRAGAVVFDYGNNLRAQAQEAGVADAFDYPGFVPAFIRPQFCEGRGPFRWAALSGDPADIARTDRAVLELFPEDAGLRRWIEMAQARVPFQGLPARICWLGYGERSRAGLAFNELVATGEVSAPIVIGRDHLDAGLRRFPEPRDRGDGRRHGRGRRLATPQRAGQHSGRRVVGVDPPRRRGRDRLFAARRDGRRRRRQRARRPEARARPDDGPGDGRAPPRRRGLRAGDRRRPRARGPCTDARGGLTLAVRFTK